MALVFFQAGGVLRVDTLTKALFTGWFCGSRVDKRVIQTSPRQSRKQKFEIRNPGCEEPSRHTPPWGAGAATSLQA